MNFNLNHTNYHLSFSGDFLPYKKSNISSVFGANGVGKSTLCSGLNYILCKKEIYDFKKESLTEDFFIFVDKKFVMGSMKKYEALYVNEYTEKSNSVILPKDIFEHITYNNFSNRLRYENINSSCSNYQDQSNIEVKLSNKYNLLEQELKLIIPLDIHNNIFNEKIFVYNSSSIQVFNGMFGLNRIHNLGFCIEYLSSMMGISVKEFLLVFKRFPFLKVRNIILKKIYKNDELIFDYPEFKKIINQMFFNLDILSKNRDLINLLIDYNFFLIKQNEKVIPKIKEYNEKIKKYFKVAKNLFNKFFPGRFKNIILNERFSSSLGCKLYDFKIIDNLGNVSYSFDFLNNIGSEGEKKLLNIIHLIVEIVSLPKKNKGGRCKYIITADDAFTSFDNSNLHNILALIHQTLKNKSCIFINFTHDLELYRIFNNKLHVHRENMHILNRNKHSNIIKLINFPNKKNFYTSYIKAQKPSTPESQIIIMLSTVPEYRNIMELLYGDKHVDYLLPTNVLHVKNDSLQSLTELINKPLFLEFPFVRNRVKKNLIINYINQHRSYEELMNNLFSYFKKNIIQKDLLQFRIFLSIFSRILIESWIINFFKKSDPSFNIEFIKGEQTGVLIEMFEHKVRSKNYKRYYPIIAAFKYLNSYIPEYIHMNYNLISYLINVDANNQILGISNVNKEMKKLAIHDFTICLKSIIK